MAKWKLADSRTQPTDRTDILSIQIMDGLLDFTEQFDLTEPTPLELVDALGPMGEKLRSYRLLDLSASIADLFFQPQLQSNTLRIEAMAHIAMAIADGDSVSEECVAELFNALQGTRLSRLEDPSENVMTSPVSFQDRSYLLLNGIWESNTSILQRCLAVVETMPDEDGFDTLKTCIRSLLALVDESCRRNEIERYEVGNPNPVDSINADDLPNRRNVIFTRTDLDALDIEADCLRPFTIRDDSRSTQEDLPTSNSFLHRFPLIREGYSWVLAMPASVPIAIREFLAEAAVGNGFVAEFADRLNATTIDFIQAERVFGIPPNYPLAFRESGAGPIAECASVSDSGEVIHLIFVGEDLADIAETRTVGLRPLGATASSEVSDRISRCASHFRKSARLDLGLTLIVDCGVGRTIDIPPIEFDGQDWCVEHCSLEDLVHMNRLYGFEDFDLVKILQGKRKAEELGVTFDNHDGIATLVAWVRANEGHVVRSQDLPKEFRNKNFTLSVAPSFIQHLRAESSRSCDIRDVKHVDGSTRLVRIFAKNHFAEDALRETYAPVDLDVSQPSVIFVDDDHSWWFTLSQCDPTALNYERLEMLRTWIGRIAESIRDWCSFKDAGATEVKFRFSDHSRLDGFRPPKNIPTVDEIQRDIGFSADAASRIVMIQIGPKFEIGTASATNDSEVALLRQVLHGIRELPGIDIPEDRISDLVDEITGGPDGRHLHGIVEQSYRDRFGALIRGKVVKPNPIDNCNLRLGLAFEVESKSKGRKKLKAKRTCTQLLNKTVTYLEDELCRQLRQFDRENVVRKTLTNYEAALFQRERWERTAHANIAIHKDKEAAMSTIIEQVGLLDGVIQPSRLLVEVAVCECPDTGGKKIGEGDLSRLLTIVNAICILGGWSDAIHMNAMPPELEITPLGDILADTKFEQEILSPFHGMATGDRVDHSVENREKIYASAPVENRPDAPEFDQDFREAIRAELGLEIEDVAYLADKAYELGLQRNELMFETSRPDFEKALASERSPEIAKMLIEAFVFPLRDGWRNLSGDEDVRNIQLWRLRRTLSVLRRPIIEVMPSNLLISPDMVNTAVFYVLRSYYEGTYRQRDLQSKPMCDWWSTANNRRGTNFAERVAAKLTELGWVTSLRKKKWIEVQMTEILADKAGKKFGDVDVIAFDPRSGRVLCIECKALHFHKTHGEVAEQLSDYRGELNSKGKPDDLLKHLNRIELLRENTEKLAKFVRTTSDIVMEPLLVFENPVPMLFAWKDRMKQNEIATFSSLAGRYDISRNNTKHEDYQDHN